MRAAAHVVASGALICLTPAATHPTRVRDSVRNSNRNRNFMNTGLMIRSAIALLLLVASAAPADAQVGRLKQRLREKVEDTATRVLAPGAKSAEPQRADSARTSTPAASDRPAAGPARSAARPAQDRPGGQVLEITPALLDDLARALAAEEAKLQEIAPLLASWRSMTPEKYEACREEAKNSPEGQQILAAQGPANAARARALLGQLSEQRCGGDPRVPHRYQSLIDDLQQQAHVPGASAGGFGVRQYAILKERVTPFCAGAGLTGGADGGLRIPGRKTAFYVYSRTEAEALRARCEHLRPLLQAVL